MCSFVFAPSLSVHVWAAFGGSVYACLRANAAVPVSLSRRGVCVGRGRNKKEKTQFHGCHCRFQSGGTSAILSP